MIKQRLPAGLSVRQWLYKVIFESDTREGQLFDALLLFVILLSVLTVMLESVAELRHQYLVVFLVAEWIFTILFTIEYLLRIFVSANPKRYVLSFYGIVDLLAILPMFITMIVAGWQYLAVIRVLRLLRVARIFKLAKFLSEGEHIRSALKASLHKILVFIFAILMLVIIIGSVMYIVEGPQNGYTSIPIGIYWAIVTLTTVGYGDISPQSSLGQFLASLVMLMGYGIIAVPTGIVTVELGQARKRLTKGIECQTCGKSIHETDARYCSRCSNRLPVSAASTDLLLGK